MLRFKDMWVVITSKTLQYTKYSQIYSKVLGGSNIWNQGREGKGRGGKRRGGRAFNKTYNSVQQQSSYLSTDRELTQRDKHFVDVIPLQDWKKDLNELRDCLKTGYWKWLFAVSDKVLFPETFSVKFMLFKLAFLLQMAWAKNPLSTVFIHSRI